MNTLEVQANIKHMARTHRVVQASKDGTLPTKIEVLQAGVWDTPYHGIFEIHLSDLQEMVNNFTAGVAMAGGSIDNGGVGLPIDFGHESGEEAAGWIKDLTIEGMSLYANVEWTAAGTQALTGGNYKCFSPEFYPGSRGGWPDPERYDVYIPNVLVGGGLTNIPLFKGLKPVMASTEAGQDKRNVIYISASEGDKHMPTLEEVLAKNAADLNDAEKDLLTQNKDTLTDEQKTKFGFEVVTAAPVAEAPVATEEKKEETPVAQEVAPELASIAASVKSGEMVAIKASEYNEMKQATADYRLEKATQVVTAHAERGAIKADQIGAWAERLVKDATIEDLLNTLNGNTKVTASVGSSNTGEELDPTAQIMAKAHEAIKASKEAGKELDLGAAIVKVRSENQDLAAAADNRI